MSEELKPNERVQILAQWECGCKVIFGEKRGLPDCPYCETKALREEGEQSWKCFHCDEVFTDYEVARKHFGNIPTATPRCVLMKCICDNCLTNSDECCGRESASETKLKELTQRLADVEKALEVIAECDCPDRLKSDYDAVLWMRDTATQALLTIEDADDANK